MLMIGGQEEEWTVFIIIVGCKRKNSLSSALSVRITPGHVSDC
jgi:hypothetical protein